MDPSHSDLNGKFKKITVQSEWSDPFVKNVGFGYRCTLCDVSLNSLSQVRTHIVGAKHHKLLNSRPGKHSETKLVTVLDSSCQPFIPSVYPSSTKILKDPHILVCGTGYQCTLCSSYLNSIEQACNHIAGQKHRKFLEKYSYRSPVCSDPKINVTNQFRPEDGFMNEFKFRDVKVKNVMSSLKFFGVDDPIIFSA